MAILAQLELASAAQEALFSVPFKCTVDQMNFCNRTSGALSVRVWIVKRDEAVANKNAYVYDISIPANDRAVCSDDFGLEIGDRVWTYASGSGISATVFGRQTG